MAIHCDWLVLCQRVIEDSQSGSLSLVDCLDRVVAPAFPARHGGFAFAAYFSRHDDETPDDDQDYEFRLVRATDTDEEKVIFEDHGHWPVAVERMRVFVNFATLTLNRPEVIAFRIDWRRPGRRWTHGPSVPLRVELLELSDEQRNELQRLSPQ